ncbi:hypothetical protein LJR015_002699 [Peribacillus frigoritolerans]|uniref:hypothetical protein n=1 Tax=Peribacillus frigoritolerans TaxID=450367 RepID=UPI003ECDC4A3
MVIVFRQKGIGIASRTLQTWNGPKKFATLLPNNRLAETPQALVPRRLGRQSAERKRVSESSWNVFETQLPSLC